MIGFIRKEAAEILGVKPSLIQYYTDQGIITPGISAPVGRGTRRKYSKTNLLEILIVRRLVERGLSLKQAKNILTSVALAFVPLFDELKDPGLAEKQNLMKTFWRAEAWDPSTSAFIFVMYKKAGSEASLDMQFVQRGDKKTVSVKIGEHTQAVMIINVTDLIVKVAEV